MNSTLLPPSPIRELRTIVPSNGTGELRKAASIKKLATYDKFYDDSAKKDDRSDKMVKQKSSRSVKKSKDGHTRRKRAMSIGHIPDSSSQKESETRPTMKRKHKSMRDVKAKTEKDGDKDSRHKSKSKTRKSQEETVEDRVRRLEAELQAAREVLENEPSPAANTKSRPSLKETNASSGKSKKRLNGTPKNEKVEQSPKKTKNNFIRKLFGRGTKEDESTSKSTPTDKREQMRKAKSSNTLSGDKSVHKRSVHNDDRSVNSAKKGKMYRKS